MKRFQYFKNIFNAPKNFRIIIISIYKESVSSGHEVPIKAPEERNFISEQSIEMVLQMSDSIKLSRSAVGIIRCQLETIEVFAGK